MSDAPSYAHLSRAELAPFIPVGARRVLDVGCAGGGFGATLRTVLGPEARLVGIEADPVAADRARRVGYDEVLEGLFPEVPVHPAETFDLVTFNDVLEHMVDPWDALRRTHGLLSPGGAVLASIPNIAYLPALRDIAMRGRFDYTDAGGVFDRTHLRFFTRSTILQMFDHCGYAVHQCAGIWDILEVGHYRVLKPFARIVGDRRWLNFVVVATPIAGSGSLPRVVTP